MKKKSTSQSAFFNLRVLIGLFIAMAGISLALLATANPSRFVSTTSSHPQTAQMPQKYNPLARSASLQILPPGFDCSKIHRLGYDTMENFRAHLIMVACGVEPKGKLSPATAFSKLVKSLLPRLPSPLAYGGTDVDLITSPPPENFPSVTQSETYTTANPDNPDQILAAYNDSSGAGGNPANYSGASFSSDGGLTFTRINPNPFAAAGANFGDPIALYNKSTGSWHTIWIDTACGGFGIGGYKTTDPLNGPWSHYCVHNGSNDDRESAWVENNPSSPFFGRMYVSWNNYDVFNCGNIGCLFVTHSTDDGASWSTPVQVSPNGTESRDTQITGDMSGNGKVYVAGMNENGGSGNLARNILMYRSTDGGATFANTFTSATFDGAGVGAVGYFEVMFPDNGGYWRHMSWGEPAAFNGVVHYVYSQHGTGSDAGDVYYIRSTDDGFTFGTPVKLNTDATTRPQWQANLSESPSGTLLAMWYDGRDYPNCVYGDPNTPCYKMYARKSNDNGASWLADDTFSDVGSPLPAQPDGNVQGTYAGDYDYGSAIATKHLTSWVDGRVTISGTSQQDAFTDRDVVGFSVTTADPACGSVVDTQPTDFIINLSDPVDPATVQASDFTVNGTPADDFTLSNGNTTITFHFNTSPVQNQGAQTMHIPAGAFNQASNNDPVLEFQCTFRYDATLLAVTDTIPPVGSTFDPPGPASYTLDLNLNEAVDPASVQTSDLHLSGVPGTTVDNVQVINGDMTAEFTITINSIFSGTLTVNLPAGAITDTFGNGNAAFSGNYEYVGTAPKGCGLFVGSGMTLGFLPNGWNPTLASNTVQYTFALSQPAANEFALFETHDPWGSTVLKDAITSNGHTYTEFTPADLATVNFSDYRVVVLNWDDTTLPEFITPYTAAIPFLEAYAGAGGVVWVQAAVQGGGETFPMPFGGQGNDGVFGINDPVVDPSSPMMIGMPNPIPGNAASHVSYTGLPGTAHVVVLSDADNNPALYDIQVGGNCGGTPTPTATATATPTATATVTPRATPTPRPRPTPGPRP